MSVIEDAYPLSPIQQGILYESLISPPGIYLIQPVIGLPQVLDLDTFTRALDYVTFRHPILRSAFRTDEKSALLQEVYSKIEIPFEDIDLSSLPAASHESELARVLETQINHGFDLDKPALMRFSHVKLDHPSSALQHQVVLALTYHHAIMDAHSLSIFLKELFTVYDAYRQHTDVHLDQPTPYRHYVQWIHDIDFSGSQTYWRSLLQGISAPTPVGTAVISSSASVDQENLFSRYRRLKLIPPPHFAGALQRLVRANDITLNTVIQAAWGLLLARYSGENVVLFGATRSCQHTALDGNTQNLIGPILNTLPVRADLDGASRLLDLLKQLRSQWLEMRPYENTPLSAILPLSGFQPGQPLFHSFINYVARNQIATLRSRDPDWAERTMVTNQFSPYPLILGVSVAPDFEISINYDRTQIDDHSAQRMLGHLDSCLQQIASDPNRKINQMDILSSNERQQILVEWTNTVQELPQWGDVVQAFEHQVVLSPSRACVLEVGDVDRMDDNRKLSYSDLNTRANQLAHYLQIHGVTSEIRVGLYLERKLELLIAFWAILKSGGVYLPLDPTSPPERLAFILQDSKPSVVITDERFESNLPDLGYKILCLDRDWLQISSCDPCNLVTDLHPQNLAYVIYTSGSTGRPKGVMISHMSLKNLIVQMMRDSPLSASDRLLQMIPISFDPSIWDFLLPLLSGALLVLPTPGSQLDIYYMVDLIQKYHITVLHLVTSVLELFMLHPRFSSCLSLRIISAGAEPMPLDLPSRLLKILPANLKNSYGPTETCIIATSAHLTGENIYPMIPIGKPLGNIQVYILNSSLQPQPVGVAGEIFITGIGVARGYQNHPALTADKFIPDPFGSPGSRLYRTGDLGCFLPSGEILYLGRIDEQIKIGGVRIEPGEIERVLESHPLVNKAAVILKVNSSARFLVAFVEIGRSNPVENSQLQAHMKRYLPSSMLPSAIVQLAQLPHLPGGKLDRQALQSIETHHESTLTELTEPAAPLEILLAGIFERVLGRKQINLHDNFFDLGGNSLSAMQAVDQISNLLNLHLSVRLLFEAPTVEKLSLRLIEDFSQLQS